MYYRILIICICHATALYCTVLLFMSLLPLKNKTKKQHSTVQYSTVQYNTIYFHTLQRKLQKGFVDIKVA